MFLWALEVAKSALFAQQTAIYVTSHNIANVNTPEYSRQQVVLSTLGPVNLPVAFLGRGVWVEEVRRIYDRFLTLQINYQQAEKGYWEVYQRGISYLEAIFGGSEEEGLGAIMDDFFNAWHDLSANPQGYAERTALLAVAQNLVEFVNYDAIQLEAIRRDYNQELKASIEDINRILEEIADINGRLRAGRNDLFDERDGLLKELAQYINFTVMEDDQGRVTVLVGGIGVVEGLQHLELQMEETDQGVKISTLSPSGIFDVTSFVSGGKLGALLEVRNRYLPEVQDRLDQLAKAIIFEVNRLHSEGEGLTKYTSVHSAYLEGGLPFEVPRGAFTLRVYDQGGRLVASSRVEVLSGMGFSEIAEAINHDPDLNPYLKAQVSQGRLEIAARDGYQFSFARGDEEPSGVLAALGINGFFVGWDAKTMAINLDILKSPELIAAATLPESPGDNSNALAIAELQNRKILFQATQGTFKEFYAAIVGDIGLKAKDAMNRFETSEGLLQSLENRRQEISGVSMDEEMINLIRLQRSYEAAVKVIGVVDELLQTLISLR